MTLSRYFGKFNRFRNDRWVFGDKDTGADPDPAGYDVETDLARGFVVDPGIPITPAVGRVTVDLLSTAYSAAVVPPDVYRDSKQALHTHPGGVALPAAFMVAEFVDGHWTPASGGLSPTPSSARRGHAWYLRVWLPYEQRPRTAAGSPA